jgi:hypothetical protein
MSVKVQSPKSKVQSHAQAEAVKTAGDSTAVGFHRAKAPVLIREGPGVRFWTLDFAIWPEDFNRLMITGALARWERSPSAVRTVSTVSYTRSDFGLLLTNAL